ELTTGVQQTVVDVRRGVDYLQGQPAINRRRIGLVGISMGAIIGTVAAGVEPRLKATALISGGGDWALILKSLSDRNATVGGKNLGAWKGMDWSLANLFLASVDPLTFAPHIAPRALLMECGRKDTIILPRAATELYQAARQPKQIDWYAGYGHVPPPEAVYPTLQKWFAQHL
ncbi:MAG: hypothetical protein M3Y13_13715, partial [Armatimonadota bacterium]|nr:hypothetical protein [Armatimonadota bacterium]